MNEWISRVFGQLLTILHVIVVLGLLVFWLGALDTSYNNLILTLMTLGIFLMYVIIIGIITSTLLWADLNNIYIWTLIFVSLSLGLLGFIDDLLKIKLKNSRGLNSKLKFFGQLVIGSITLLILIKFSKN